MATVFRVTMTGGQEVPSRSSQAVGRGTVIFDEIALTAFYTITVTGLDFGPILDRRAQTADTGDDVTNFHVHNAARGVNGNVVFGQIDPSQDTDDLRIVRNQDGSWTLTGRWETTDPASTSITNFASILNSIQIGSDAPLYFNAHTNDFPGGEIRGQWVAIANEDGNIITGSVGADFIPALGGNDIVFARRGNDSVDGGTGNDLLFGEGGNDTLRGSDGNDTLFGGGNDDRLVGGSGDDRILGESGHDKLFGGDGDDRLFGWTGNDHLDGGSGADILDGGVGNDNLLGGSDNDGLIGGNGDDRLNGGSGDDRLNGGTGEDSLSGGLGNDTLFGGSGADSFTFNTALGSNNVDTVRAFNPDSDRFRLDNAVFTGLSTGTLSAEAFYVGTSAIDASDRIIYDSQSGALYFDPDGTGGSAQVQFATLEGSPNITRFDFFIF